MSNDTTTVYTQGFYGNENDVYYVSAGGRIWHVQSVDAGETCEVQSLPEGLEKIDEQSCDATLPQGAIEDNARADGWAQTHEIVFTASDSTRTVWAVMLNDEGAAHTAQEWLDTDNSAWGVSNGEWLCEGQATPGGQNGEVYVRQFPPGATMEVR
jgi:hypothetical protein